MSSNEIISRKSRYSEKYEDNSSICNRSLKSEFNNLSIDLPQNRRPHKHSSIERELLGRRAAKTVMTINLACTYFNIQLPSTPYCMRCALRLSDGGLKILEKPEHGKSNGVILELLMILSIEWRHHSVSITSLQ